MAIPVYHFQGETLNFANSATSLGFCLGLFIYPVPTTNLFFSYGFNYAILLFSPIMLMHIFGVVFMSQNNSKVSAGKLPGSKTVTESIKAVTSNGKVK